MLVALVTTSKITFAQAPSNIKFTNYTRAQGLPHENVQSITQDSRGFIWIGSTEGLFRFDGQNFKAWYANPNDSNKFSTNSTVVFEEYQPERILFMSASELWEINISNFKLQKLKSFANIKLTAFPTRINSDLWVASSTDSIFFADKKLSIVYSLPIAKLFKSKSTVSHQALHYPYVLLYAANSEYYIYNYTNQQYD